MTVDKDLLMGTILLFLCQVGITFMARFQSISIMLKAVYLFTAVLICTSLLLMLAWPTASDSAVRIMVFLAVASDVFFVGVLILNSVALAVIITAIIVFFSSLAIRYVL